MVEQISKPAFGKLTHKKYLIIEMLQSFEYAGAQQFLFAVNNETRRFSVRNFATMERAFTNEGLIIHSLILTKDSLFETYRLLE